MTARDDEIVDNGENEENEANPTTADEVVEGGRAFEDSPIIPGGATADTTKNVADADDTRGDEH